MPVQLRNPHSILAVLQKRPKDVVDITLPPSRQSGEVWDEVASLARASRIRVMEGGARVVEDALRKARGQPAQKDNPGRISSAHANIKERTPISVEELFRGAESRSGGKGLWLALDSLQDPQNVGAIFRTAAFFGAQGILLTEERSAPLTGTVYDVASGGLEQVPFATHVNLQRAFEVAKKSGLWILGTSEHAQESFANVKPDRPWLVVLGNEEKGMRRLTEEACDQLVAIPPADPKGVASLNVSVAAGIFIAKLAPG